MKFFTHYNYQTKFGYKGGLSMDMKKPQYGLAALIALSLPAYVPQSNRVQNPQKR